MHCVLSAHSFWHQFVDENNLIIFASVPSYNHLDSHADIHIFIPFGFYLTAGINFFSSPPNFFYSLSFVVTGTIEYLLLITEFIKNVVVWFLLFVGVLNELMAFYAI